MKCLLFKVDAGIKYLQIETEVKDDPNTRQIAWHLTPDHGVDNWQVGRVSVKRGQPYKIVITTQRSNAALGYVAIDDFEFIYGTEDCSIMPELARPTTTTTTTTPPRREIFTTAATKNRSCDARAGWVCGRRNQVLSGCLAGHNQ